MKYIHTYVSTLVFLIGVFSLTDQDLVNLQIFNLFFVKTKHLIHQLISQSFNLLSKLSLAEF